VRRRGRGIPVVVVLFVALAFGITSSSADTAGIADTATAPIAADVSAGLQSFAQALTGLDGLNQLGQSLPFTSQTPAATNGLDFAHSFVDSLKTNLASHVPFNSLLELQTYLSTGIDSTYGGVTVHATGAIAPVGSLYTIDLTLDLSRTGTTPLALDTPQTNVDGGSLATTFHTTANLTFKYDPAQADGNKFYLDEALNPLLTTTVGAAADFTATPFDVNLGFTKVHVGGTAGVGATITAQLQDPDGNGKVTQTEWSTTAPQSEFDVAFTASHANANVSLSSDILTPTSGSLANATITEADSNLANGLDAPSVSLGDLGDFKNIQPQEFLSGLASFAIMVQSLESSGPAGTAIPFLQHDPHALPTTDNGRPVEHIADFLKLNQSLIDFFTANGLNNPAPADPLSLNLDPAHLASVATIQQVTAQLETSLGMSAGALGIAYDPTTHKLTFNLGQTKTLSPITGRVDVADQLQNIGITGVQAAAQATITPSYDWSAKLGLDLSSATTPLPDRFFVVPSATHFSADFPVTGALDLAGQIGFLGVSLKSAHAGVEGPVDLLAARNTAHPMLNLQLKNNAHPSVDQLSFSDIFNAFGSSSALANPLNVLDATDASDVFNVTVPTFDLNAKATLGDSAPSLLQGKITVAWDKVTDPGTLSLTADGTFNDQLLNFDFDSSNPAAMFTTIMNVLGPFADQLSQLVASNPNLQREAAGDQPELRRARERVRSAEAASAGLCDQPRVVPPAVRNGPPESDRGHPGDRLRHNAEPRRQAGSREHHSTAAGLARRPADRAVPSFVRRLRPGHGLDPARGLHRPLPAERAAQRRSAVTRRHRRRQWYRQHRHRRQRDRQPDVRHSAPERRHDTWDAPERERRTVALHRHGAGRYVAAPRRLGADGRQHHARGEHRAR